MTTDTDAGAEPVPGQARTPVDDEAAPDPEPAARGSGAFAVLLSFTREEAGRYVLATVLATLGTLCQLGPFFVIYLAIRDLVAGEATLSSMLTQAGAALLFLLAYYALSAVSTLVSHRAAFRTLARLRTRIGQRLTRVPMGRVTGSRSGTIQRTLTDEVERLEGFLAHAVPEATGAVVAVLATTVWMFLIDWRLALAAVACLAASLWLSGRAVHSSQQLMGGYLAAMARMNGSVVEMVRGMPIVRTFNRTGDTFTETRDAIRAAAEYQADWGLRLLPAFTASFTLAASPALTVVPVGLLLWTTDSIALADLLFFFVLGLGYGAQVTTLVRFSAQASELGHAARVVRELKAAEELPEGDAPADPGDGSVEFVDVSFRYPGATRAALHGVSFRADPGTVTALVGPSGAGKSTVAQLVCRFFDVDSGAVRVGGSDVRALPFAELMERVSFVLQETFLFDDSIDANLRLARPEAGTDEVEAACRAAQAHDFITALPEGYATRIGEHGARLSGGQRQRLSIARALLKDAQIIVLDEATAFIDPENEVATQAAIDELVRGRTVIMIAHRLSTVVGADQILVIDDGQVTERGRHAELLGRDGRYAQMWQAFESAEQIALGRAVHDGTVAGASAGSGE
ncbi:ABC transporter ATP-binding protein [Lipingzhangella sp. LS1_29]|uniref:ABC transporter ATP-binding protein n=1 Tax=Lipingzhangella rawalii TaxID=2055835 RepID=A0ABU2HAP6_9ACTN|nr:ABC transporter ATP-binding protein [Lipingzhangella rawalii]MDS1272393.1 ABC transporter ATP-binding protein [Lipingzhangella rawalii]